MNPGTKLYKLAMTLRQVGRIQIGRILGSVPTTHGGYKALIDLLERCYFMRAEINALTSVLLKKGIMTEAEWLAEQEAQFDWYLGQLRKDWPEIEFQSDGFTIKDPQALVERSRREGWPP